MTTQATTQQNNSDTQSPPRGAMLLVAGIAGALCVALGAAGAHILPDDLPDAARRWQTAVRYHQIHAVVLLALALSKSSTTSFTRIPFFLFAAGLLLFCGSLYVLALGGPDGLAKATPLGGLALIAAWISCCFVRAKRP